MAEKRRFRVDDILRWKIAGEVSIGPDSRVAYTVREADLEESSYRSHIWSAQPGAAPVRLTRGEKNTNSPRWAPDGRHLAFLTNRTDGKNGKNGEDAPKTQIWLLPAAGGEAFCLTKAEKGIRSYLWMPDGQALLYVAEEPEQEATKSRKGREKSKKLDAVVEHAERRRRQIWQVEAREGAQPKLIHAGDRGLTSINISPDGEQIVYNTNYSGMAEDSLKYDLWLLKISTGERRQLTSGTGNCWGAAFSPDSRQIAFIGPRDPKLSYSRSELFAVPAEGGPVANLCDRSPLCQADIADFAWESNESLIIQGVEGCYTHVGRFTPANGEVIRLTPANEVVSGGFDLSPDRRRLAFTRESWNRVPEVALLDLHSGEIVALTDLNPWLSEEIDWGNQRVISWENEGLTIEGILTLPPEYKEGERLPLLVYVHGGPHSRTPDALRQYFSFQALAAEGYAVLAPNYRGGTGRGHQFAIANRCDLGGGDFRDIMAGVDQVIAMGVADPDRMGILGGSYGGYMTNWAIGQTDRFKAAVSLFGIFSLVTDYSQSDWPGWELGYLDGYWWENPEPYTRCAPATHAHNMKTPVLIIHGDADNNTNPANSREMYQTLRHLGRSVQYVRYPREGHGLQEPNHKKDEYRRLFDWFRRYLLGQSEIASTQVMRAGAGLMTAGATERESYSGRKPKGRYLELALALSPGAEPLKLDLAEVRLLAEEGEVTWECSVAGVAAGRLLVPANGSIESDSPVTLPLVFDIPGEATVETWRLETETFPAMQVILPKRRD